MSILLNSIVLVACILWFHYIMRSATKKLILPVVGVYLLATVFVFIVSMSIQAQYLDGLLYILTGAACLVVFWIWTTIVIIIKNVQKATPGYIWTDLLQTTLVLLVPLLIWLWLKDASFKIGG